jgi:hypothetical protein
MQMNKIKIDQVSTFVLFGLIAFQLLLTNGIYLFACLTTFTILFFYLQQVNKPGVFTLILLQHLLQIIATIFLSNYLNKDINYRSPASGTAIIVSLGGLTAMLLPVIYFQSKLPIVDVFSLKREADKLSITKTMYCYIIAFFLSSLLGSLAFLFSSITQIIISVVKIKWLFFLLFGFQSILKNEKRNYFYAFIGLEFLSGFFSFFSDFKTVIYFVVILILSFVHSINFKQILLGTIIGFFLIYMALLWTSVKSDYRSYLNGGQKNQTVTVNKDEALSRLYDLSNNVDQDKLSSSTVDFLDRLQYTYHFAKTIERVPAVIPFQNGDNWLQNIEFTTTPRFFNPDKPILDNSVKTSKYTGIRYAGQKQGASFSLGYFAEFYIDFGIYGMMLGLLVLGFFYGKIYYYLIMKGSKNLILNYAVAGSFFMEFNAFEMDGTYLLGRLLSSLLTYYILIHFFFPFILQYIRNERDLKT